MLGEYNKRSTANDEQGLSRPTRYTIIEIITHPDFKDLSVLRYNDIALFRLNKDVEINEYIRPICLHTENQLPKTAITTGYISGKYCCLLINKTTTLDEHFFSSVYWKYTRTSSSVLTGYHNHVICTMGVHVFNID